jgi:hypothetical protein
VLAVVALGAGSATAVSAAEGPVAFGVAEDAAKYAPDHGASIYASLNQLGMTIDRWTLTFGGDPTAIPDQAFLDQAVPAAQAAGIELIFSVYPATAPAPNPAAFCSWVGAIATRYPTVTHFIIGNEVNASRFWAPQHTAGDPDAGPRSYEQVLARCYDTLKAINPSIAVIGLGLAPRAVDASSTAPLDFIRAVGAIYRASGRTTPLMDELAIHPYPNPNANPPPPPDQAAYQNPGFYGIPQLDRVKQAVYDAFNGTGQPTTLSGLGLLVDEIGYQTAEVAGAHGYTGSESSPTVSEEEQAAYYARVVSRYACDPAVSGVLFFHLIDEQNLNTTPTSGGWQSGLERPDGTQKPSFASVQQAIAAGCTGAPVTWTPGTISGAAPGARPHGTHAHGRQRTHCFGPRRGRRQERGCSGKHRSA